MATLDKNRGPVACGYLPSPKASPLRYQGQEYDPEVGLTAFNLRQYDARLGRWQTPDPYGQHHSPYLAMSNNPVSFTDPDGGYDWQDYHNDSKREMDAWSDQMRQADNPELLVGGRLAYGQALNMDALIGETMVRYFKRNPIASVEFSEGPVQKSPHTPEDEDDADYELGWPEISDQPATRRDVVREYWNNFSSEERQEELIKLARKDHRVATWIVNNPKFSNEMRGLALVARSDDFSKAVHALITSVMPIPAVGAATGGGRALFMAGKMAPRISRLNPAFQQGFSSFSKLKRHLGPAGKGRAWHHIVEQTPDNIKRFGAERIHNVNNIINVAHGKGSLHAKVSGFFSSRMPGYGRVRDMVGRQSFEEQYDFGVRTLERFFKP